MALSDQQFNIIVGLINNTRSDFQQIRNDMQGVQQDTSSLSDSVGSLGNMFKVALGIVSVQAIVSVGKALLDLADQGTKVQETQLIFQDNFKNSTKALESFRNATHGVISDQNLMQLANNAVTKDMKLNTSQISQLMQEAQMVSRKTNTDMTSDFNLLARAIATGTTRPLKALGIEIPDAIAKSKNGMVSATAQAEILNDIMKQSQKDMEKYGNTNSDNAQKVAKFNASMENLRNDIAERLAPVLGDIADFLETKLIPVLQNNVGPAFDMAGKFISQAFEIGKKVIGQFISELQQLYVKIKPGLDQLMSSLKGLMDVVFQVGQTVGQDLVQNFMDLYNTIAPYVIPIINQLMSSASEVIDSLKPFVAIIGEIITDIADYLTPIIQTIAHILGDILPPIIRIATDLFKGIGEIFKFIWSIIQPILDFFVQAFKAAWKAIQEGWDTIVKPKLQEFTQFLSDKVAPALEPVRKAFSEVFNWIKANVLDPILNFIDNITLQLAQINNDQKKAQDIQDRINTRKAETDKINTDLKDSNNHFAGGADFIIPRGYESDNFPIGYGKTGERVQITPANQTTNNNTSNSSINITNNISNPIDANSLANRLAWQIAHQYTP